MAIYLVLSSVSAFFALLFSKSKYKKGSSKDKWLKRCLFLLFFALVFFQTFRSINVGGDLHDSYYDLYHFVGEYDWNYVVSAASGYEIGYLVLNKIVYTISGGKITALLFAISIIYLLSLYHFIKKASPNRFFSIFLFLSIGIYNTSMNNLRSTMALSLILLSLCFYLDRKWFRCLLFVGLGILFHKTVIVFILFYFMSWIKSKRLFGFLCILLIFFFTLGFPLFRQIVLAVFPRYANYFAIDNSGGGFGLMAFLFLLAFVMLFITKKEFWKNKNNVFFYKMLIFSILLQFISIRINFFSRTVFYFLYSVVILLPLIFSSFKSKDLKLLAYWITIIGMTAFYIYILVSDASSTVPYEFIF